MFIATKRRPSVVAAPPLGTAFWVVGVVAALVSVWPSTSHATTTVELLNDSFADLTKWVDLSEVVAWATSGSAGESAFVTTRGVLAMTPEAQQRTGFSDGQTRMFQAIDHRFAYPVDRRRSATVTIDFSAKWDARSLSNEGSRLVVSLNHDYPEGGLDLTPEGSAGSRHNDFSFNAGAAWARPAYSLRIRTRDKESLLAFGGGPEVAGGYEATTSSWLPGFIQAPGGPNNPLGGSPQVGVPGVADAGFERYSQSEFLDYRYRITPDRQELWIDLDRNGQFQLTNTQGDRELVGEQVLNMEPLNLGGIDYTRWFERLEGVRLFWRGQSGRSQAEIDSLRVAVEDPSDTPIGDYNNDGRVDVADYTLWRDTVGRGGASLPNDPFGGEITQGQYQAWAYNFGLIASSGGGPVPEASGIVIMMAAFSVCSTSLRFRLRNRH